MRFRYPIAALVASVVALALFLLMNSLIAGSSGFVMDSRVPDQGRMASVAAGSRESAGPPIPVKAPPTTICPANEPRPVTPPMRVKEWSPTLPIQSPKAWPATPVTTTPLAFRPADGLFAPVRQVEPVYPLVARYRGLEGFVEVEFDVTAAGSVENARVVESSHAIFEAAALRAVERSLYRPRIVDGEALPMRGLRKRIRFQMERG